MEIYGQSDLRARGEVALWAKYPHGRSIRRAK